MTPTNPKTPLDTSVKPRVAYLLADAGIPLLESKKGSSIHARSMIQAFEQEGCAVDVYVLRKGRGSEIASPVIVARQSWLSRWWLSRWLDQGVWRRFWPFGKDDRSSPPNWMTAVGWLLWHFDFYRTVARKTRRKRPDFIYARNAWFSWPYLRLKRRLEIPLFVEVNALFLLEKADRGENAFDWLSRRIERALLRGADRVLPVSDAIRAQMIEVYRVKPQRIVVTPNAVNMDLFSPVPRESRKPDEPFVVGAVNSMRAYHGMGTLLAAAARLRGEIPGLRLLLIGGGPLLDKLKEQARELGVDGIVEWTGVVDHVRVPERLRECHLCVAPYEGEHNQYNCPMKLFEYMALNIPVVAARWGDIPNIVEDRRTGLLHAPGDPGDLAGKIRQLWRDPDEARRLAEEAYQFVQNHTWRAVARRVLDWREQLTGVTAGESDGGTGEGQSAPTGVERPIWEQHVFRASMTSELLADYNRRLEEEMLPEPVEVTVGRVPGYTEDLAPLWMPDLLPGQFLIYTALMKTLYYILAMIGRLQSGSHPLPKDRPLRVLRMSSVIAQGGVAKVCLQSTLATPPERVEYHLLFFGKKRKLPPELLARPHLNFVNRKLLLWPSSYRFGVFRSVCRLARLMWKLKPDLIHVHEPQFAPTVRMAAALAGGVPVFVQLHNDYTVRQRSIHAWAVPMTLHALRESRLIACSRTIQRAAEIWLGLTRYPIALIMDGNDDVIETPIHDDLPERLERAANGRLVVAMMANLMPHKRIDDFLSGCRILLDEGREIYVLLMAYGKEGHSQRMRRKFNRMFAPHEGEFLYNVAQTPRMLVNVAIGVSTSAVEGLGLNILEYQAAGVPVVCTDMMPHREMVTDGETGLLFEGLDIPDFVRKMRRLLGDEALRRRLGESGRAAALGRRWNDTAAATLQCYGSVFHE